MNNQEFIDTLFAMFGGEYYGGDTSNSNEQNEESEVLERQPE